ncbi:insulin-degrading enzyme-like isoform X2 [Temnothorax longispinosus]|uniref:insulin-degrading enzyme-like isoform X2 n=1 Tax=Temnothorax longispinosus TaxID=300112 RepID=UPI003A997F39
MSTDDTYVDERFDNIEHADNDVKSYRGLVLKNKMKILLISDPLTHIGCATMNVNIGYNNDPEDLPGLAHLCQHLLGTESQQHDYLEYLNQYGGSRLARTRINYTDYSFNIIPEKLGGALDLFAQFFIAPLFDKTLIETEINIIDLEYKEKLINDRWRMTLLEKLSVRPDYPFGIGNKKTLDNINVKDRLEDFYKKYSAHIMSLCVLGKDNLNDLESMVVKRFRNVKNKKVELSMYSEYTVKNEDLNTMWKYVPIFDIRELCISFSLLKIKRENDLYLIGHKGENSLLSALKAMNWCIDLEVELCSVDTSVYFFKLQFDLTEEGINNIENIVEIMFQYIHTLKKKKKGPMRWIFDANQTAGCTLLEPYFAVELEQIMKMCYSYEKINRLSPDDIATTAYLLQKCPMKEIFSMQREWRPDLIDELMEHFMPENIKIYVASKTYEDTVDKIEEWFDIKYKKEKIPKETIKKWRCVGHSTAMKLPSKNDFIPIQFDIKEENVEKFPVPVMDTSFVRVWHKKDDVFRVPKATMIFHFVSPIAYMDPLNCNLTDMFVRLLRDFLNDMYIPNIHKYEYTRTVNITSLNWEIARTKYGITLKIDGYDDKQSVWLQKSVYQMRNFEFDPKRFEILKEKYIRELKNFATQRPFQHPKDYLELLLAERHWSNDELLESTAYLSTDKLQDFIQKLFTEMHVECLIHGNVTKEEAKIIGKLIESNLKIMPHITPLLQEQLVLYREIKLEDGCHVRFEEKSKVQKTSSTIVYYATGLRSTKSNVLLSLFAQIIKKPCFDILKTKKQLGNVHSDTCKISGTQYLMIAVQGDNHLKDVEQAVTSLIKFMIEHITNMPKKQFDKYKDGLISSRLKAPDTITSQCSLYWKEIESQEYNFDRANIEVNYLRTITRQKLQDFIEKNIYTINRRILTVHVTPTAVTAERDLPDISRRITVTSSNNETKKFDNLLSFKRNQILYPLLEPIEKPFVRKPNKM